MEDVNHRLAGADRSPYRPSLTHAENEDELPHQGKCLEQNREPVGQRPCTRVLTNCNQLIQVSLNEPRPMSNQCRDTREHTASSDVIIGSLNCCAAGQEVPTT